MSEFLYGASVQGIQGFILQTNELKDIVGASELVEKICTTEFDEFCGTNENSILRAAGNIKHIFKSEEECKKAVRNFPRKVMEMAPGITISQAVVKMENDFADFSKAVDELEKRLHTQRNKPPQSLTIGLMGIHRSRKTGLPAVKEVNGDYLDIATSKKREKTNPESKNPTVKLCKKSFGMEGLKHDQIAYNIEDITEKNDWIAIIHADGNGVGKIVQKIGTDEKQFRLFSKKLDDATKEAAQAAFNAVKDQFKDLKKIPIRPVVLGGDDLTIICRGDFAITYTNAFLRSFEKSTQKHLGQILLENNVFGNKENKLTACAGIAFIKSSYPFYYGYHLAEELCSVAKKDAKMKERMQNGLPPSCLMFHKVQDSFVESYDDIVKRELMPRDSISFSYGPYYLESINQRMTVKDLMEKAEKLSSKEGNAIKSHIRQWMGLLYDDPQKAEQKLKRVKAMASEDLNKLISKITSTERNTPEGVVFYPAYDILSVHSVINQQTKEKKNEKH